MVDGSAPGQVTDMLVVFKTPAWVLEIAGKSHQTRPQTIILTVIEVCALQLRHPHMRGRVLSFGTNIQSSNGF